LRLGSFHRKGLRTGKRKVIREVGRQPFIDLSDTRIDGPKPSRIPGFRLGVTLAGFEAQGRIAHGIQPLPCREIVLPLANQRCKCRIALRSTHRHLRDGLRGLRTDCPLRDLERFA
jgi:hypothetical protein